MGIANALSIATGGIANINTQLALVSNNVANASTPGYAVETATQTSIVGDGISLGVFTGPAQRQVDQALNDSLQHQNAAVNGLTTTQTALQSIDSVLGAVGQANDLGGMLNALQGQFSTLLTDPSSQAGQSAVVSTAGTLTAGINTLSATYTQQRQVAQNSLVSEVNVLNQTLATIGQLNNSIIAAVPGGQSTAGLKNQRDGALQVLSGLLNIKTIEQPNGDLQIYTAAGTELPTRTQAAPFSLAGGSAQPGSYYPGNGLSGIMLGGADVTAGMVGGSIGANLTLRDKTLPTDQASLDEFSYSLATRFAAQGLTLFSDSTGAIPSGGGTPVQASYVGFAASIQVNPAVQAAPSLVRDGTNTIVGNPTGASAFTPNPPNGPASFTTLISRVLNFALGSEVQTGVTQPAFNSTGLGPGGTLTAPFSGDATLANYAADMTAAQSSQSASATSQLSTEQAVQTSLKNQVNAVSGVNMDTEMTKMITLQNAYSANARVIATLQSMFNQLLQAVQ